MLVISEIFLQIKKLKHSLYTSGVAQSFPEVNVPRFLDNGTG
jgi:hypothetical protein